MRYLMNTRAEDIFIRLNELKDSQTSSEEIDRIIEDILNLAKERGYSGPGFLSALEFMLAISIIPLVKRERRDVLRDLEDMPKFLRRQIL